MKKIYSLILVAASLAVAACQPKELDNIVPDDNPDVKSVKITATIEDIDATKVEYAISDDAIKPAWEVGDELFGFDADGGKFTYVVTEVDATTGEATIEPKQDTSYDPAEGILVYGIYYPGKTVDDITGTTGEESLAIDLAGQSGTLGTLSPAIMCATATVEGGEVRFHFENQTAIIGLKKIQLGSDAAPVASATIDQIAIEGVVTRGSLSVVGGELTLKSGTKTSTVYAVPTSSNWETDANGQIDFGENDPVAFAVLPKASSEPTVYAYTSTAAFKNNKAVGSKEMAAGHYYYMSKKLDASAAPVASLTVGGVTSRYYTINAAFDAADCSDANSMITLLANCGASSRLNLTNSDGNGNVTLDLNGFTLTGPTGAHCLYVLGRTLAIQDSGANGAIESAASSNYSLYVNTGANATLNSGTISSSAYRAIGVYNDGTFTMNGGTVSADAYGIALAGSGNISVTGGSISGSRAISSISLQGGGTFTGTLSVSGGTLVGESSYGIYTGDGEINLSNVASVTSNGSGSNTNAIASAGTVNITGGTFTSASTSSATILISGEDAVGIISGGRFNSHALSTVATGTSGGTAYVTGGIHSRAVQVKFAVSDNADEYVNILNTDDTKATYPFAVGLATSNPAVDYVAQGSNYWKHATVEGAFINANQRAEVAAGTGTVITQLADATASATLNVNSGNVNSFTLDLNGHTVSATGVSPLIAAASDFTLMDSDGEGELSTTGNVALSVNEGTTTVNSGSLVGATKAVSVAADATLTVNNGYFYGAQNGVDIDGAEGAGITLNNGWYRNKPSVDYLASGTAAIPGSEPHNTKTYNWTIGVETATVTVNEVGYASLGAAVAAANTFDGEAATVTITLLDDISYDSQINLTNANSKPIVLDLNGCTLSTEAESFITTGGNLTITDSGSTKGKITSSESKVLDLTTASAAVTLNGCVIEGTKATGANFSSDPLIDMHSASGTLNFLNAKVYTTAKLSVLRAYNGTTTITGSELSSGTVSEGWYVVVGANTGTVNMVSGSLFTSGIGNSSTFHISASGSTMTVADDNCYLYSNGRVVSSGGAYNNNITLNGGYYNKLPSQEPSYGAGLSMQAIDPAETHAHATIGETLYYGYQVKETPVVYVAEVNGKQFTSYADAITEALAYNGADDTVRLTLLQDVSYSTSTDFVNTEGKPIVLNLGEKTLETTVTDFIKCTSGSLSVRGGTITSTAMRVVNKTGTGAINIENCTISSTATYTYSTGYYYDQGVIRIYNGSSTVNIKDSKIFTTGAMTAVADRSGILNIDNSEISSGTESMGGIAVCAYSGTVTINSGCFYSSNDTTTRPAAYVAGSGAYYTINDGYFYSASSRSIRAGTQSQISNFTIYGGYFNKSTSYTSSGKDYAPTIPAGYAQSSGASGSYEHSIVGTLSFNYKVGPTDQEASVEASTSEPVVTLGEARNGGVSF